VLSFRMTMNILRLQNLNGKHESATYHISTQ